MLTITCTRALGFLAKTGRTSVRTSGQFRATGGRLLQVGIAYCDKIISHGFFYSLTGQFFGNGLSDHPREGKPSDNRAGYVCGVKRKRKKFEIVEKFFSRRCVYFRQKKKRNDSFIGHLMLRSSKFFFFAFSRAATEYLRCEARCDQATSGNALRSALFIPTILLRAAAISRKKKRNLIELGAADFSPTSSRRLGSYFRAGVTSVIKDRFIVALAASTSPFLH